MPDPLQIVAAMALAFALAALALLAWSWLWSSPGSTRRPIGEVIAVGIGFAAGCWWLGAQPHWPPREDLDRLLLIVLPAAGAVEIAVALLGPRWWICWSLRLVVMAAAAPIVLYGSVYLSEAGGPGTRLWTPTQIGIALTHAGRGVGRDWVLLTLLGRRTSDRSLPLAVAVACLGASATVMLSGYATGGEIGLPLAAVLAGTACASLFRARPANTGSNSERGNRGVVRTADHRTFLWRAPYGFGVLRFFRAPARLDPGIALSAAPASADPKFVARDPHGNAGRHRGVPGRSGLRPCLRSGLAWARGTVNSGLHGFWQMRHKEGSGSETP